MINQKLKSMNWVKLESPEQVQTIKERSDKNLVLIFKHSTQCSTSRIALERLERNWKDSELTKVDTYQLDLLEYRSISNMVATEFSVTHESPQVLLIKDRQSVYDRSHFDIVYKDLVAAIQAKSI